MLILDTTQTESEEFRPSRLWGIGIDTYSAAVTLQWRSPGGVWIDLGSYESVGRWQLNSLPGDVFRLTTSTAGSRAYVSL